MDTLVVPKLLSRGLYCGPVESVDGRRGREGNALIVASYKSHFPFLSLFRSDPRRVHGSLMLERRRFGLHIHPHEGG